MRRIVPQPRADSGSVFPALLRLGLDAMGDGLLPDVSAETGSEFLEQSAKAKAIGRLMRSRHHRTKLVDLVGMGFTRGALGRGT